jgi:hypothetical protein
VAAVEDTPRLESLLEEYRERHVWLRYWSTEQRLVALAVVSLNGAALADLRQFLDALSVLLPRDVPSVLFPLLMFSVGALGFVHNNRLCDRYDRNGRRLFEVARELKIKAAFQEDRDRWPDYKGFEPKTMRAWFYLLYVATMFLWMVILLVGSPR